MNKMKFSIVALVTAVLTQSVATAPSPDPGHLEVVLSLDDANVADKPMIASPSCTLKPPPTATAVTALLFAEPNSGVPGPLVIPVDGKSVTLS